MEKLITKGESIGESNNSIKRQLLNLYCKNKDLEKATALKDVSFIQSNLLCMLLCILIILRKYKFSFFK